MNKVADHEFDHRYPFLWAQNFKVLGVQYLHFENEFYRTCPTGRMNVLVLNDGTDYCLKNKPKMHSNF